MLSTQAYIYCRVSTKAQIDSLSTQEKLGRQHCRANGWKVRSVVKEVGSAYKRDPPKLGQLVAKIQDTHLVCQEVSRISRNVARGERLMSRLKQKNIHLSCIQRGSLRDAEYESRRLGMRIRTKILMKKKSGVYVGSTVPYGYMLDNRGRLTVNPWETHVLMLIKSGESVEGLNSYWTRRDGTPWTENAVKHIRYRKEPANVY